VVGGWLWEGGRSLHWFSGFGVCVREGEATFVFVIVAEFSDCVLLENPALVREGGREGGREGEGEREGDPASVQWVWCVCERGGGYLCVCLLGAVWDSFLPRFVGVYLGFIWESLMGRWCV
jgi:hypothetical protein